MKKVVNDFGINKWLLFYSLVIFVSVVLLSLLFFSIFGKYNDSLSSYEVLRDYSFDIVKILGVITVIVAIYHLGLNRKKLNFDVIESCISRFKEILENLLEGQKSGDIEKINTSLHLYVHLVNEELFYMANEYIPEEVSKEWIDGMIEMIPLLNSEGNIVNEKYISYPGQLLEIIKNNPRVYYTFHYDGDVDLLYSTNMLEKVKARKRIVNQVLKNLNQFSY